MADYHTRYPAVIMPDGGGGKPVATLTDPSAGLEQYHIVAAAGYKMVYGALAGGGFTRVRFEHRRPRQIGAGLSLKLARPWEMHVRISDMPDGGGGTVMIHAEVEVSRDYMQHLFSQRTPVVYEVAGLLEKNGIACRIWSGRMNAYVASVVREYRVRLSSPALPPFAWKPMVFSIGTVGALYLAKYLLTTVWA